MCFDDKSPDTQMNDDTNKSSPTGFGMKMKLGAKADPIRIQLGSTIDMNPDYNKPTLNQEKIMANRKY